MPFLHLPLAGSCSIVAAVVLFSGNQPGLSFVSLEFSRFVPATFFAQARSIGNAEHEIQAAWKALDATNAFQVHKTEVVRDKTYVATEEFIRPDRYHQLIHSSDIETVVIGDTQYQRIGNHPWSVSTLSSFGYQANQTYTASILNGIEVITNARQIRQQILESISTHAYEYDTVSTLENDETTSINRLWVNAETGLPYRWEITVTSSHLEPPLITETVAIFSYQSNRSIEPPI